MNRLVLPILFFLISISAFAQNISPSVFNSGKGSESQWLLYKNNDEALYKIITDKAFNLLDKRKEKIDQLQTRTDWLNYQTELKEKYRESLNKFKKTPLNARVTSTLKRDNYTVEKIIFESHPGFYVTSCLFLPKKRQKPAPAIIYCSGHTDLGFRSEVYQRVILNLVEKGFVVFAFDPIGQGERLQYVDPETGKSKIGGSTSEHSYAGVQTLLAGTSLSDYFIWDGVRAVDYLETRKEVDAKRIGITGRSGGGTQSAEIAAYDDRIYAAAPECYITNLTRLLQSIGPQDAEQNPYNFIKKGMDHPDFLHIRAPKPTLIVTTTHDFFSQQGARETFAEVNKSYAALGYPDNIQKVEDFGVHESTKNNREAVYAFFQKFLDLPGDNTDHDITPFKVEELLVTPTGQVGTSLKGETVFSLNQKYFSKNVVPENELKQKIQKISGIKFNQVLTAAVYTGKITKEGFDVKKYFLENDKNNFVLPLYVIQKPDSKTEKTLVWLPVEGKKNVPDNPLIPELLAQNYTIIVADLPDTGELSDPEFRGDGFVKGVPFNYTFGANLVGKSIPGIRAEAIDLLMQFVNSKFPGIKTDGLAEGGLSEALLHYTILKKGISKLALNHTLESNLSLIQTEYYDPQLAYNVAPGSLSFYDFKDLVKLLPANAVKIINPVNAKGEETGKEENGSEILKFLNRQ
jgi:cephalosporin-C deacetylase-like acetyl esterase